jgi:tetratricopeptide (TPR) repeat protein
MKFLQHLYISWLERRALNTFVDGDYEKSLRLFLKLQTLDPKKVGIEYNLGLIKLALKQYEEAESYLLIAKERDESFQVLSSLADLYYLSQRRIEAANMYKKIVDKAPDKRTKHVIQNRIKNCKTETSFEKVKKSWKLLDEGLNLEKSNDLNSASELYKQAFLADQTNFIAANNYGTYCMNFQKDYKQAQEYFRYADKLAYHPVIKDNLKNLDKLLEK